MTKPMSLPWLRFATPRDEAFARSVWRWDRLYVTLISYCSCCEEHNGSMRVSFAQLFSFGSFPHTALVRRRKFGKFAFCSARRVTFRHQRAQRRTVGTFLQGACFLSKANGPFCPSKETPAHTSAGWRALPHMHFSSSGKPSIMMQTSV